MATDIETLGADKSIDVIAKHHAEDPLKSMITEDLSEVIAPHPSYEGFHRFDPRATWTVKEERAVVWKTDLLFLSWICIMVRHHFPNIRERDYPNLMAITSCSSLGCS